MRYTELNEGEEIIYTVDELPDLYGLYSGTVAAVYDDHIIVDVPKISDHLWIDEDNEDLISRREY